MKKVKAKAKIRFRSEPKKPKRQTIKEKYYVHEIETLDDVARFFVEKGVHPSNVKFISGIYSDNSCFYANVRESDQAFNKRMIEYEQKLEEYNEWRYENRALIEKELERRRVLAEKKSAVAKAAAEKRLERIRKQKEKELAKLQEELKKLQ